MKKLLVFLCVLILTLGVLVAQGAQEKDGETYKLMFSHALTENDPYHDAFIAWADAVQSRTNGGLIIDVFANSQLGAEEDVIEQMRTGANIGHNTDSARLGNYVPEIAVFNGPYMLENVDEVKRAADLPIVKEWEKRLEEQFGLKVLSFAYIQGHRNVINNKPVYKPSDLSGQKLRTAGAPIWQESVRSIGATPVAMGRSEIYSAAQTKAIDGLEDVYTAYTAAQLDEVLKVVSETNHIYLVNFSICSASWFNSLPKEYQEILVEEADKAGYIVSEKIQIEAEKIKAQLIQDGITVIENSELDMEAFRKAGEKAYEVLGITEAKNLVYEALGK
ncbi:MAG: C4-dicarboxylate TRAP transporter substrate-binding protein [Sphaerochaetaceae bacterium]|nr:C4-dicarboxylate TRAP transporter substrate-binding protein [Sphaerochaetaceae bacterium]